MPKLAKYTNITHIQSLLIGLALLISIKPAYSQADSLSLGKTEYEQQNYHKALSHFDHALSQDPNNATTLYYRANTLIKLGLKTQALLDYQQAYRFTNSAQMQTYCKQAISSLASNTAASAYNQTITPGKQSQLGESLGTIQLQSALDKVRIVDSGELLAQDATIKQQIRLAKMHEETERQLQQMRGSSYYDQNGKQQSLYSDDQIQQYSQQRKEQEDLLNNSIQKIVRSQTEQANERAQFTEQSASNLESQLVGSNSPNGVKLNPLGTNLYIRNYEPSEKDPSLPQPPAELKGK